METPERVVKANVRRLRRQHEWTLADLSERMDRVGWPLSVKVLSKLESTGPHSRSIGVDDLVGLAKAFGVEPGDMLVPPQLSDYLMDTMDSVIALSQEAAATKEQVSHWRGVISKAEGLLSEDEARLSEQLESLEAMKANLLEKIQGHGIASFEEFADLVEEHWLESTADAIRGVMVDGPTAEPAKGS